MGAVSGSVLLVLCAASGSVEVVAGDDAPASCCTKHTMPFIVDVAQRPPDFYKGQPRRIPDPSPDNVKPADWDDDEDGLYEPREIDNPKFTWEPGLIPNPDFKPPGLAESLRTELEKAAPWTVVGVLITAGLESVKLSSDVLIPHIHKCGPVLGALLGLVTPLCSCGTSWPVAGHFVASGVPLPTVVAFLTATQSTGLDSAAVTAGLLGPQAAMLRLVGAVVLAVASGLAVSGAAVASRSTEVPMVVKARPTQRLPRATDRRRLVSEFGSAAAQNAADVFPNVFLGLCMSCMALHIAPRLGSLYQVMQSSAGGGEPDDGHSAFWLGSLLTRLLVLVASLPLQLNEFTTVAYASAIQKAGGESGLAFAFLLLAPATNLPSMLLLIRADAEKSSINHRQPAASCIKVAVALTTTALILSYIVDMFEMDVLTEREADERAEGQWLALPQWYIRASPFCVVGLSAAAVVQAWSKRRSTCCTTTNGGSNALLAKEKSS